MSDTLTEVRRFLKANTGKRLETACAEAGLAETTVRRQLSPHGEVTDPVKLLSALRNLSPAPLTDKQVAQLAYIIAPHCPHLTTSMEKMNRADRAKVMLFAVRKENERVS